MNKTLHKNLMSFFLLFSILAFIISGAIGYIQYYCLSNTYSNLIASYQTVRAANQSIISIDEAALNISAFLDTKDPQTLAKIAGFIIAAKVGFENLKQLVINNEKQRQLIKEVTPLFEEKIAFLSKITEAYSTGNMNQLMLTASDKNRLHLTNSIDALIIAIKQEEIQQLAASNMSIMKYKAKMGYFIVIFGLLGGIFFVCYLLLMNQYLKKY